MNPFADRLFEAVQKKESALVVGIDPEPSKLPDELFGGEGASKRRLVAEAVRRFSLEVLHATHDAAVAVKPQLAYFERLGFEGMAVYEELVREAQSLGLLVIADGKRGDIGSTAEQYAMAFLGPSSPENGSGAERLVAEADAEGPKADALTVNPYLGSDGIRPFLARTRAGKGLFLLAKTSNPSSSELQDLRVSAAGAGEGSGRRVYEVVGEWAEAWCREGLGRLGYGSAGLVVGATHPRELKALRAACPHVPFLVPGVGAQGATAEDVAAAFDRRGLGAVVNASRSILYAYLNEPGASFTAAARRAALSLRDALRRAAPLR